MSFDKDFVAHRIAQSHVEAKIPSVINAKVTPNQS